MQRVRFIDHRERRVLSVDFSGLRELAELEEVTGAAISLVRSEPPRSVLVLIDLSRVPYSLRMARNLAEVAASNTEYVLARAVVGLDDLAHPLVREVAEFTGAAMESFDSREQALDWLAQWPASPDGDPVAQRG